MPPTPASGRGIGVAAVDAEFVVVGRHLGCRRTQVHLVGAVAGGLEVATDAVANPHRPQHGPQDEHQHHRAQNHEPASTLTGGQLALLPRRILADRHLDLGPIAALRPGRANVKVRFGRKRDRFVERGHIVKLDAVIGPTSRIGPGCGVGL